MAQSREKFNVRQEFRGSRGRVYAQYSKAQLHGSAPVHCRRMSSNEQHESLIKRERRLAPRLGTKLQEICQKRYVLHLFLTDYQGNYRRSNPRRVQLSQNPLTSGISCTLSSAYHQVNSRQQSDPRESPTCRKYDEKRYILHLLLTDYPENG